MRKLAEACRRCRAPRCSLAGSAGTTPKRGKAPGHPQKAGSARRAKPGRCAQCRRAHNGSVWSGVQSPMRHTGGSNNQCYAPSPSLRLAMHMGSLTRACPPTSIPLGSYPSHHAYSCWAPRTHAWRVSTDSSLRGTPASPSSPMVDLRASPSVRTQPPWNLLDSHKCVANLAGALSQV